MKTYTLQDINKDSDVCCKTDRKILQRRQDKLVEFFSSLADSDLDKVKIVYPSEIWAPIKEKNND